MKDRIGLVSSTMLRGVSRADKEGIDAITELDSAEWLMRCVVLGGASRVSVDLDGKAITALRFQFRPGGQEHRVDYPRPALPHLMIAKGGRS